MKHDDIKNRIKEQQDYTKPEHQKIVCAANLMPDGVIVMGVRHCCPQMLLQAFMMGYTTEDIAKSEQGFIDNYNNFLSREDARPIAVRQGVKPELNGTLFSEDLY